jgi:cell division protein FtsB
VEEEGTRIGAEYRELLKNAVAFEKRIRNRWREKNRQKNARISKLEARIKELEREVELLKGDRTQG